MKLGGKVELFLSFPRLVFEFITRTYLTPDALKLTKRKFGDPMEV